MVDVRTSVVGFWGEEASIIEHYWIYLR